MSNAKQLEDKMLSSQSFKKEMQKANQNYEQWNQQAHYSNLSAIEDKMITKFETERSPFQIYFFYAAYQPTDQKLFNKMLLSFITKIPKPHSLYLIVYVNDDINGGNKFTQFKNLFNILPFEYYSHLQRIYLLRPSLRNRASKFFSFSTIAKFINNRISEIATIDNLCENLGLQTFQVFKYLPDRVRESFQKQQQVLRGTMIGSKQVEKKQQMVLAQNKEIALKQIHQYQKSERGVPQVLELLIYYFKENEDGLLEEGIFRKSVNIEEETEVIQLLTERQYSCLEKIKNPHIVANVIKRFFAKLATPVIPFEQFNILVTANPLNAEKVAEVMKIIEEKNLTKLLSLILLLEFLIKSVIPKHLSNKMSVQNVSICIAPCLMWAKQRSIKDLVYINKSVQIMGIMLQNFEKVFGNKKEQKKLFRNSYNLQKKQSLSEAIAYEQEIMKQNISPHHVHVLEYRKTPTFGQLVIKHTESQLQGGEEDEDTSGLSSHKEYSGDYQFLGDNEQKHEVVVRAKSEIPAIKQNFPQSNGYQTYQKKNEQCMGNTLQVPNSNSSANPNRRGIFSSHIGFERSSNSSKSIGSNQSIKSLHSDK